MMIVDDLKQAMSMREISFISGIPLSEYYYVPRSRKVTRLDPSIGEMIKMIAAERPTYGYRRVWAVLRNGGVRVNSKTVESVLKENNLSLPYARHRGRTKTRNLFHPTGPDQLWETDSAPSKVNSHEGKSQRIKNRKIRSEGQGHAGNSHG
ncbi:MAG: IS3 family transposase [Candidatus Thermoplasmatota archaeon]|nr:IS3 family transposase [Candidatus Thermoplasmatota archaeon]